MSFGFSARRQQQQEKAKQSAADVYRKHSAALAKAGDLSDAHGDELEKAGGELGIALDGECAKRCGSHLAA